VLSRLEVTRLDVTDLRLIGAIDRSETIGGQYVMTDGVLVSRPVTADIPSWETSGDGPHSVAARIAFCEPLIAGGAAFAGVLDGPEPAGLMVVDGSFEPPMAWLAFLHVNRPYRRQGVASALWDAAIEVAVAAGADEMYVSATPTDSAVGFYLSRGCGVADPVHPDLHALEPDDVHLTYRI